MTLETKIIIYKFTPQVFTLTPKDKHFYFIFKDLTYSKKM